MHYVNPENKMIFKNQKAFSQYKAEYEKCTDAYEQSIFEFAQKWAIKMQNELFKKKCIDKIIDATADEIDTKITGMMFGEALKILIKYWGFGNTLSEWLFRVHGMSEFELVTLGVPFIR